MGEILSEGEQAILERLVGTVAELRRSGEPVSQMMLTWPGEAGPAMLPLYVKAWAIEVEHMENELSIARGAAEIARTADRTEQSLESAVSNNALLRMKMRLAKASLESAMEELSDG